MSKAIGLTSFNEQSEWSFFFQWAKRLVSLLSTSKASGLSSFNEQSEWSHFFQRAKRLVSLLSM